MTAPLARYAVIGNPVAHSQSPFIHAEFARATGQALSYERVLCPLDGLAETLQRFAAEGGLGCNITVPFKFQAGAVARRLSPRATLAQAANILKVEDGGWSADNSDGVGLLRDIQVNAGLRIAGGRVLLVGAGGAAAGVLGPLVEALPKEVVLANRSLTKAQTLADRHADWARGRGVALHTASLDEPGEAFDLVINATSASLQGLGAPIPAAALRPGCLAVDLMYGEATQAFLDWARAHGAAGRDGLGMLVEQAAEAFAWWRGVRPETAPVLQALRARLGLRS